MKEAFAFDARSLRGKLVDFASLIELEPDFSEEDGICQQGSVVKLLTEIQQKFNQLFQIVLSGSCARHGSPSSPANRPNAGQHCSMPFLGEARHRIRHPGTTRDTIEEQLNIHGIVFRLVDICIWVYEPPMTLLKLWYNALRKHRNAQHSCLWNDIQRSMVRSKQRYPLCRRAGSSAGCQ